MTDEVSDVANVGSHVSEQSIGSEISALRQRLTIAEQQLRAVDDELMWEGTVLNRIETLHCSSVEEDGKKLECH